MYFGASQGVPGERMLSGEGGQDSISSFLHHLHISAIAGHSLGCKGVRGSYPSFLLCGALL